MSVTLFLHMGGYAFYVWLAYGVSLVLLLMNIWLPLRRFKQIRSRLKTRWLHKEL